MEFKKIVILIGCNYVLCTFIIHVVLAMHDITYTNQLHWDIRTASYSSLHIFNDDRKLTIFFGNAVNYFEGSQLWQANCPAFKL